MRWPLMALSAAVAMLLFGCATPNMLPDDIPHNVQLTPEGLKPADSDLTIDFGRAEAGVIAAVTRLMGTGPESRTRNEDCGAGPIDFVSWQGLDLLFMDGALRGWSSDDAIFITSTGLSAGLTRAEIDAPGAGRFEETTLGTEFEADGIFGIMDGPGRNARVRQIWAGVSCFFR